MYTTLDPKKLKQAREDAKLAIPIVASQLQLSEQQIRHFETGFARPLADTLFAIFELYNIADWRVVSSQVDDPKIFHLRKNANNVAKNP